VLEGDQRFPCSLTPQASGPSCYGGYVTVADWISQDIYPANWQNWQGMDIRAVGRVLEKLKTWSHAKPLFAYQEITSTGRGKPAPTPDQLRFEVWDGIVHGARGIAY
jgi:hypothetical protein